MSFVFVLVTVLILIYILWRRRKSYLLSWRLKTDLRSYPLIGHGYMFVGNDEDRMKALQRIGQNAIKYDGLTSLWLGPRLFVVVINPSDLEIVMKFCLNKDDIIRNTKELHGNGSVFAPVSIWRPRRKAISPNFSMKKLNIFVKIFDKNSKIAVERLQERDGRSAFSLWQYLAAYTMDSVCETTLGVKLNAQNSHGHPFLNALQEHFEKASARYCLPLIVQDLYKYTPMFKDYLKPIKLMHEFIDEIIQKKRKVVTERRDDKLDDDQFKTFLDLCIESSGVEFGFTNLELREEALVMLIAGTDTSAVGAAFTCIMLSMHPDVQEKAYEELQEVFGNSDRPLSHEDLPRLKYLELVIKESLRLYPPVPIIVRKVDNPITLSNGLTLDEGTSIVINIWAAHRNPRYWGEDAHVFRPERFIDALPQEPNAFIPFSGGPRSCIGYQYAMMSMKTIISALLRQYKLLPANPQYEKHTLLRVKFDIMMKHVDNFEVQLEARVSK